jgi:cytochrome c oxidase subunit 4
MSERTLSPITYILVDAALVLFTVLTVALSFVRVSGVTHLVSGLVIGLIKASLVVLFFMHAFQSRAQTRAVIVVTVFWLIVVLMALTFSDYFTRGWIPSMPGH